MIIHDFGLMRCVGQRLIQIPQDVIQGFQAHRQPNHVRPDARRDLLFFRHLAMRGGGRVNDQGFGVADIGQMAQKLHPLDKFHARVQAAFDAEGQHGARPLGHVFFRQVVILIARQRGVIDVADGRVIMEKFRHGHGVFAVPVHAHMQGLQTL